MALPISVTMFSFISAVGGIADLLVSKNEKEALRLALLKGWFAIDNLNPKATLRRAADGILEAFDVIYGKEHFTWRCFSVSAIFSILFVLVLYTFFSKYVVQNLPISDFSYDDVAGKSHDAAFLTAVISIFCDYVCLAKARWILRYSRTMTLKLIPLLVLIDIGTSWFLFSATIAGFLVVCPLLLGDQEMLSLGFWKTIGLFLGITLALPDLAWGPKDFFWLWGPLFSTLATSTTFVCYCAIAFAIPTSSALRERTMHLLENLFATKTLFTSIAIFISSLIMVSWVIIHTAENYLP